MKACMRPLGKGNRLITQEACGQRKEEERGEGAVVGGNIVSGIMGFVAVLNP
jgi:hypothetical protein